MKDMKLFRRAFLAAVAASAMAAAEARAEAIAGAALQKTLAGKTVIMSTSLGSLPITYRSNGTMSANSKAVGVATGVANDTGRWWVSGGSLCQKWRTWFAGRQYCHAMSKKGETLYWVRNDGMSGTAKVLR